jgi:hypothetical protein
LQKSLNFIMLILYVQREIYMTIRARAEWANGPQDSAAKMPGVSLLDGEGKETRFVPGTDVDDLITELRADPTTEALANEVEGCIPSHI